MFWRKKEKKPLYQSNSAIGAGIEIAFAGFEAVLVTAGFAILTLIVLFLGAAGAAVFFGLKYFGVM
jgi:hypothetical protein